ncbi:MAG: DUF5689 domain-containing protein [bacterium]
MLRQFRLYIILYLLIFAISFINVQAQTYNVYFGDLHQHSAFSWDADAGAKTPATAYAYAKHVAKIDFMAITDHTNGLSESNYQHVRTASEVYADPESLFVAIAGQELGSMGSSGYGHINIFEPRTRADNASDDGTRTNRLQAYQFLIDNDLLGQFNHPTTSGGNNNFNNLEYFQPVDVSINTLEVINGKRSADYEQFYLLALANGWHLGAVGDQDNHAGRYGDNVSRAGDIYLTGVLADSLTKPKILDAIKNHRTYAFETSPATDRMHLTEFTADSHWMGDVFDNDDNVVEFRIAAQAQTKFISAQLYKNNHLIKHFEPDANDFEWEVSDSASFGVVYYFLKLIQEDTDVLWSSPVWVNSSGQYQEPGIIITSIADLKENFANGLPRSIGQTNITIRGVATAGPQFGTDGPGYIQDGTGGISVFGSLFVGKVIPNFPLEFEVTGVVSFFNGLTEIIPHAVERSGVKAFPQPRQLSTGEIAQDGEKYEGQLVTVIGAQMQGIYPATGNNGNLTIDDGSGSCTLRIDKDTNIPGTVVPQGIVNITGIVGQFDTAAPYDTGYQILPRSTDDISLATGVNDETLVGAPKAFALHQNYPNPFNASTIIRFDLPQAADAKVTIFNILGQRVKDLASRKYTAGQHQIKWHGRDNASLAVASGIFLVRVDSGSRILTRKMLLVR